MIYIFFFCANKSSNQPSRCLTVSEDFSVNSSFSFKHKNKITLKNYMTKKISKRKKQMYKGFQIFSNGTWSVYYQCVVGIKDFTSWRLIIETRKFYFNMVIFEFTTYCNVSIA